MAFGCASISMNFKLRVFFSSSLLWAVSEKFLKNKLLLSFLAIVLVIKLIKIKIFWILPLIVGVTAAKKLLLKFILFLFPALAHLFKLCSYYHKNYHDTKYHHHHHQINHLHTVRPSFHASIQWIQRYNLILMLISPRTRNQIPFMSH